MPCTARGVHHLPRPSAKNDLLTYLHIRGRPSGQRRRARTFFSDRGYVLCAESMYLYVIYKPILGVDDVHGHPAPVEARVWPLASAGRVLQKTYCLPISDSEKHAGSVSCDAARARFLTQTRCFFQHVWMRTATMYICLARGDVIYGHAATLRARQRPPRPSTGAPEKGMEVSVGEAVWERRERPRRACGALARALDPETSYMRVPEVDAAAFGGAGARARRPRGARAPE